MKFAIQISYPDHRLPKRNPPGPTIAYVACVAVAAGPHTRLNLLYGPIQRV